jgi:hypothetical protein
VPAAARRPCRHPTNTCPVPSPKSQCPVPAAIAFPAAPAPARRGSFTSYSKKDPHPAGYENFVPAGDLFPGARIQSRNISAQSQPQFGGTRSLHAPIPSRVPPRWGRRTPPGGSGQQFSGSSSYQKFVTRPNPGVSTYSVPMYSSAQKSLSPFSHKIAIPPRSVFYAWIIFPAVWRGRSAWRKPPWAASAIGSTFRLSILAEWV